MVSPDGCSVYDPQWIQEAELLATTEPKEPVMEVEYERSTNHIVFTRSDMEESLLEIEANEASSTYLELMLAAAESLVVTTLWPQTKAEIEENKNKTIPLGSLKHDIDSFKDSLLGQILEVLTHNPTMDIDESSPYGKDFVNLRNVSDIPGSLALKIALWLTMNSFQNRSVFLPLPRSSRTHYLGVLARGIMITLYWQRPLLS